MPVVPWSIARITRASLTSDCCRRSDRSERRVRHLAGEDDFNSTAELDRALNDFERHYNQIAKPFVWNFTREKLADLLARLDEHAHEPALALAA